MGVKAATERFETAFANIRWRSLRQRVLLGATLAAVVPAVTQAGHDLLPDYAEEPMIEFAFDEPVNADHHLTESLSFGARLEIESESEINFDLDSEKDDDFHEVEPKVQAALAYEPNARVRAFAEVALSRDIILESPDDEDPDLKINLKQAYVTLRDVLDGVTVSAGRQYMGDEREWLLDEELDGAAVYWRDTDLALELAYGREGLVRRDLKRREVRKRPDFFIARGFYALDDDSQINPFVIYRDDNEGRIDQNLLFLGIQSFAELDGNADIWADGAVVLGEAGDRDVRGFGFDVGVVKTFKDLPMRPYLTASVAFGSGDDGSGTDTAFRQTGLQDNSDGFGGVTSLQYYGEVLDPELSNLGILTLGAGFRPSRRTSIDLVYHRYFQDRLEDDFRDVAIDEEPDGERRDIGDGVDVVIGFEEHENVKVELVGGVFLPGSAFESDDPAFFGGLNLLLKF